MTLSRECGDDALYVRTHDFNCVRDVRDPETEDDTSRFLTWFFGPYQENGTDTHTDMIQLHF